MSKPITNQPHESLSPNDISLSPLERVTITPNQNKSETFFSPSTQALTLAKLGSSPAVEPPRIEVSRSRPKLSSPLSAPIVHTCVKSCVRHSCFLTAEDG